MALFDRSQRDLFHSLNSNFLSFCNCSSGRQFESAVQIGQCLVILSKSRLELCEAKCGKGNCRSFTVRNGPFYSRDNGWRDPFVDDSEIQYGVFFECKEKQ